MSNRLKGKVCIITGTGSGMGRAAALRFAQEGARVVGCDVNATTGQATLEMVRQQGGEMVSLQPCNMAVRTDVDRLMALAEATYGGVDVLYNNGSMAYFAWLADMSYEAWSNTLREEIDLVFHACQAAFPLMQRRGGGSIINVGSTSGKIAYQVLPALAHMAAKGGVIADVKADRDGGRPARHPLQYDLARPGADGADASLHRQSRMVRSDAGEVDARPRRQAGRHRTARGVPGVR